MKTTRIKSFKSKGKIYHYHRATGRRIQSESGTEAFDREVEALNQLAAKSTKIVTLGDLCRAYLQSPEFTQQLADRTRYEYQKVLHYVEPLYVMPIGNVTARFILELRDAVFTKRKRRMANYVLQVLSLIFSWGVPHGYAEFNPAMGVPHIRKPKSERKRNRPWTVEEFYAVLDAAEGGVKIAVALGGYAAVSEGDALQLATSNIKTLTTIRDDVATTIKLLDYVRRKTGVHVRQPIHPELAKLLDTCTNKHLVESRLRRPFTEDGFRSSFFKLIKKLVRENKIGEGLTFHGLRHFVATEIANQGGDARIIMSMLGQKTVQMATHYSEQYDRGRRATEGTRILTSVLKRAD